MQEQSFTPSSSSSSLPASPVFGGNEGKAKRVRAPPKSPPAWLPSSPPHAHPFFPLAQPKSLPNVPAVTLPTWETADPCLGAEDGNRPSPRGLLSLLQPPPRTPSPTQQGSTKLPISSPVQLLLPDEEDGITQASGRV